KETNAKIVNDHGLKLAMEPRVTLPEDKDEVENVLAGKADLSYSVAVEVIPKIELADFKTIKLEKLMADVTEADIDEGVRRLAEQNRTYTARPEGAKAETGDRVVVSFKGTIDGMPFEGGSAESVPVVLGSKTFLPDFEEGVVGIAAGETRTINATFPADY